MKKVVFTWKSVDQSNNSIVTMRKLDVIFEKGVERPVIVINAGDVEIIDRTLPIDVKMVMEKLKEIDFDKKDDIHCPAFYSGDVWELMVDDKIYSGVLEDPHYVTKVKKIIRFNAIQVYANKKVAGYIKS